MLFFIPAEMSALVFFASSGCSLDSFFGCSGCSCALSASAGVRNKATAAAKTSRVNIKVIPPYCALSHHHPCPFQPVNQAIISGAAAVALSQARLFGLHATRCAQLD